MAKGQLFNYAALYHPKPTKDQFERGEVPKSIVVIEPASMVATSAQEVNMAAAHSLPKEYVDKLDDVEIIIRPF